MNLEKWNPWNWFKKEKPADQPVDVHPGPGLALLNRDEALFPMFRLQRELDRVFDDLFKGLQVPNLPAVRLPRMDISETETTYVLEADVPGMTAEDIELSVDDGTLRVRGERKREETTNDKHTHRVERSYGRFERLVSLPDNADPEKIEAAFKDGVLTITIHKSEKPDTSRRIPIAT